MMFIALFMSMTAAATGEASDEGAKWLSGAWYSVSVEEDGKIKAGEDRRDLHRLEGATWKHEVGGKAVLAGVFRIVETTERWIAVDFEVREGERKGEVWKGICKLKGDTLVWCGGFASRVEARPESFATSPGDGYLLRIMRRVEGE
ncbi:hypothetical protein BH23PLA1_BH23PLA1_05960 [soil metagenome]